eukprot:GDKI01034901.1.p1 GENE.GDKI01034901.1~~GDKI01034901.1.p1  ORF type:complete len:608 (+),score=132.01 GDKI01034901.1:2-1825(+)
MGSLVKLNDCTMSRALCAGRFCASRTFSSVSPFTYRPQRTFTSFSRYIPSSVNDSPNTSNATNANKSSSNQHNSTQKRGVRTGFFRSDPDFVDPEDVLFADEWEEFQHADDGYLRAPVLSRSNVGMGLVVVNREGGLDMGCVNMMYRKMRDIEVNTLKRFCLLTSRNRDLFSVGVDKSELLLLAEASHVNGAVVPVATQFLRNHYELSYTLHTYYKPLIALMNGAAADSGAALCCVTNRSACYSHSKFSCDTTAWGWIPDAGMSYVLARLRGSLGVYLALTGEVLEGSDIIHAGLVKHWVSPEAVRFLEVTSEKQLEVSEQDAKSLLEEHFLQPPEGYRLARWEETIHSYFNKPSLDVVLQALRQKSNSIPADGVSNDKVGVWARETLKKIESKCPIAAHATFDLIRKLKETRHSILRNAGVSPSIFAEIMQMDGKLPITKEEDSKAQILEALDERCMHEALTLETRVAHRLLLRADVTEGLRAKLTEGTEHHFPPNWTHESIDLVPREDVTSLFEPFEDSSMEFHVRERSELPLSASPKIRKLHPDYDPETGLDHDPVFMAQEVKRWADEYMSRPRAQLIEIMTNPMSPVARHRAQEAAKRVGIRL